MSRHSKDIVDLNVWTMTSCGSVEPPQVPPKLVICTHGFVFKNIIHILVNYIKISVLGLFVQSLEYGNEFLAQELDGA